MLGSLIVVFPLASLCALVPIAVGAAALADALEANYERDRFWVREQRASGYI